MKRWSATVIVGFCAALTASSVWAGDSPFVGRWHWNRAQSKVPPGEPGPDDLISEISRADGDRVTWTVTIVAPDGRPYVVTFDAPPNGESHTVSHDTTASARLAGDTLHARFNGPTDRSDVQACTVSADLKRMTCEGVLNDGHGHTVNYLDIYDRLEVVDGDRR